MGLHFRLLEEALGGLTGCAIMSRDRRVPYILSIELQWGTSEWFYTYTYKLHVFRFPCYQSPHGYESKTRRKCPPGTCSSNASYVEYGNVIPFKFHGKPIFPGCQISPRCKSCALFYKISSYYESEINYKYVPFF